MLENDQCAFGDARSCSMVHTDRKVTTEWLSFRSKIVFAKSSEWDEADVIEILNRFVMFRVDCERSTSER